MANSKQLQQLDKQSIEVFYQQARINAVHNAIQFFRNVLIKLYTLKLVFRCVLVKLMGAPKTAPLAPQAETKPISSPNVDKTNEGTQTELTNVTTLKRQVTQSTPDNQ